MGGPTRWPGYRARSPMQVSREGDAPPPPRFEERMFVSSCLPDASLGTYGGRNNRFLLTHTRYRAPVRKTTRSCLVLRSPYKGTPRRLDGGRSPASA